MPRNRMLRLALAAATVAGAASACAPAVRSDRDESIPVPRGASWAWAGPDTAGEPGAPGALDAPGPEPMRPRYGRGPAGRPRMDPAFGDEIFVQRFHRAVESTMQTKGFAKVDDPAQADFLLSLDVSAPPPRAGRAGMIGVGVGIGRPWGWYRPWGYRPWGFYRPFGWFVPWGWGSGWYDMYGPYRAAPGSGYAAYQGYYPSAYGESRLVVRLRLRSSGDVAWRASYRMDLYDLQRGSQSSVQKIVDKVFKDLR